MAHSLIDDRLNKLAADLDSVSQAAFQTILKYILLEQFSGVEAPPPVQAAYRVSSYLASGDWIKLRAHLLVHRRDAVGDLEKYIRLAAAAIDEVLQHLQLAKDWLLLGASMRSAGGTGRITQPDRQGPPEERRNRMFQDAQAAAHRRWPAAVQKLQDAREYVSVLAATFCEPDGTLVAGAGETKPDDASQLPATIPPERRTKPMSLAEAGVKIGLGRKKKDRTAAGKAVRRLIKNGKLRAEKLGRNRYVFDRAQIPDA